MSASAVISEGDIDTPIVEQQVQQDTTDAQLRIVTPASFLELLQAPFEPSKFYNTTMNYYSGGSQTLDADLRSAGEGIIDQAVANTYIGLQNIRIGWLRDIILQLISLGMRPASLIAYVVNITLGQLSRFSNIENPTVFGRTIDISGIMENFENFVANITLDNEGVFVLGAIVGFGLLILLTVLALRISPRAVPIIGNFLQIIVGLARRITGIIAGVFS